MRQHFAASIGDFHSPPMPIKQISAEFFFQQPNLSAERRLCDVKPVRGLAKATQLGNMNQGLELNDIHYQASQIQARRDMRRRRLSVPAMLPGGRRQAAGALALKTCGQALNQGSQGAEGKL